MSDSPELLKRLKLLESQFEKLQAARLKEAAVSKKQLAGMAKTADRLQSKIDSIYPLVREYFLTNSGVTRQEDNAQEKLWRGTFGFDYISRHTGEDWMKSRVPIWTSILSHVPQAESFLELGCNLGANLRALNHLRPDAQISGVEINPFAIDILKRETDFETFQESLLDFSSDKRWDFVFTRGVLIHIHPDNLHRAYDKLAAASQRYVLIFENFSPEPSVITTYGKASPDATTETDYAFYRDFATEFLARHEDFKTVATNFKPEDHNEKSPLLRWTVMERR